MVKKNETKLEALTRAVNRRKTAMSKLKKGEKPGTISERQLRRLLKQSQRRKRKAVAEHNRRNKPATDEAAA